MLFFNKKLPENALWLDIFQLDNLMRQQVPFALLDLGDDDAWLTGTPIKPTASARPKSVVETVQKITPDLQYPLVLVSNKVSKSVKASKVLNKHGFINIYVLETTTEQVRAFYKV